MSELALIENSPAQLSETGLSLPENLSHDEWVAVGGQLGRAHKASAWWIGDWINHGERKWGEIYTEAERITGLSYKYLAHCASVARHFRDRSRNLSWTHYYRAMPLTDAEEWLARAEEEGWSVRQLLEAIHGAPQKRLMPARRHKGVIDEAKKFVSVTDYWQREMTDALTPPEAKKQLTILRKAEAALAEVIEAVEYRAATLHDFNH